MMSHLTAVRTVGMVCCMFFRIGVIAQEPAMGVKDAEVSNSCDRIILGGAGGGNDDEDAFARERNVFRF